MSETLQAVIIGGAIAFVAQFLQFWFQGRRESQKESKKLRRQAIETHARMKRKRVLFTKGDPVQEKWTQ